MPLKEIGGKGHELRATKREGTDVYDLSSVSPRVPMDRDLLIAWRPSVGSSPAVAALTETRGDTTYALLMILPPENAHTQRGQPREQIFVIDTSGSMGGGSLPQAQAALTDALSRLTNADRFNVFQFNSVTSSLYIAPVQFSQATYAQALAYVKRLYATGGTEIEGAIRAALAQPVTPGYVRQVIFLTDGAVGAETALFDTIKKNLGDARLFTIGIGSAPNSYFMRKAAQFGRGTYTHIGDTAEVAPKMQALFAKLERVALADVLVDWPVTTELYPAQVPDLYAGEPLVLAASYPTRPDDPILATAFGTAGGVPWRQTVGGVPTELTGIAALWARRKIEALVDSRVDGTNEALIRKLIVDTALEHHLVSPYTSLVAVDKTPSRSIAAALERKQIMNTTPAGAQWQTALPHTATPAPLFRWLGMLVLLVAGLSAAARQQRLRRLGVVAPMVLGAALLAMGLYWPAKAALAQQLLNRAWAATRDDNRATVKPWPWADTWPVARLQLPGERAPLTVLAGAAGRNLAFAPTLLDGSAEPGTPGVTVIAGHRDTHFAALRTLVLGDEFTLERPDGVVFRYAVASLDVIDVDRDVLRLDADESVVALVTCWPFDAVTPGGPERYVVTGVPVGAPAQLTKASRSTLESINTASSERVRGARPRSRAM